MSLRGSSTQRRIISHYINDNTWLGGPTGTDSSDSNGAHIIDEDDTENLSPEDITAQLKLETLKEQFLSYTQSPFNLADLHFNPKDCPSSLLTNDPDTADLDTLLGFLPLAFPATKQLSYRAHGYKGLMANLQLLKCSSPKLEDGHLELLAVISVELDRLLTEVTAEFRSRVTMGTHSDGARHINFGEN
ncbi:hypothetical protein FS749_016083 [Ceratobasidium sp. UAMH 11750]|nr:hypothetical protein FS749_016083 [Ceratobasidium sp. UAMH 11750]